MTRRGDDDDDAGDVGTAVGCADPPLSAGTQLRRDGDVATVTCNSTRAGGGSDSFWTLRCISGTWHGLVAFNCTSRSDRSSWRIHTTTDERSWSMGQFFPLDTFPYSQSPTLRFLLCRYLKQQQQQ